MQHGFLDAIASIGEALLLIHEAQSRNVDDRARIPIVKKLQKKLSALFTEQGREVLRAAERNKTKFSEAAAPRLDFGWLDAVLATTGLGFDAPLTQAIRAALVAGATSVLRGTGHPSFNLSNAATAEYLRTVRNRSKSISTETFRQIRDLISTAHDEHKSYSEIARLIKQRFLGFAGKAPQRHIRSRAELIAITEIGDAYMAGQLDAAKQLQSGGLPMIKQWLTVGDDRVSDGCNENQDAGWIPLDNNFPSGHARPLRFPGCRCTMLTQMKVGDKMPPVKRKRVPAKGRKEKKAA